MCNCTNLFSIFVEWKKNPALGPLRWKEYEYGYGYGYGWRLDTKSFEGDSRTTYLPKSSKTFKNPKKVLSLNVLRFVEFVIWRY